MLRRFATGLFLLLGLGVGAQAQIPYTYFGSTIGDLDTAAWPTYPFGTLRTLPTFYQSNTAYWLNVEPTNLGTSCSSYTWAAFDGLLAAAIAHGTQPMYSANQVPNWANSSSGPYVAPTSWTYLYDFWQCVAQRAFTTDGIAGMYYEPFNEPDLGLTPTTGAQFVAVVAQIYSIIKAVDPTTTVACPTVSAGQTGQEWAAVFFANGGGQYCDIFAAHYYPWRTDQLPNSPEFLYNMIQYETYAMQQGSYTLPMWDTEFDNGYQVVATVSSGTYNSGTGAVSLTLSATPSIAPTVGGTVTVENLTGTGTPSGIYGAYTMTSGTGSTTVNFVAATGKTLTITGGSVGLPSPPLPTYLAISYILGWPSGLSQVDWFKNDNSFEGTQAGGNLVGNNQGSNTTGSAYRAVFSWLFGATWTSAPARVLGTNGITNPSMSGAVVGTNSGSACNQITNMGTNYPNVGISGTVPTDMNFDNPDVADGIYAQVIAVGSDYVDIRVCGTPSGGAFGESLLYFKDENVASTLGEWWTESVNVLLEAGSLSNVQIILAVNELNSSNGYLQTDGSPISGTGGLAIVPLAAPAVDSQWYSTYTFQTTHANVTQVDPTIYFSYTPGGSAFDVTIRIAKPNIDNGTTWTGNLTRGNGAKSVIAWDVSGSASFTTTSACGGSNCTFWRDIAGQIHAVSGNSVTLTNSPIILDSAAQGVWFN